MDKLLDTIAKKIPEGIRNLIKEKKLVDRATSVPIEGSPMEYLFDVYAEFIDPTGEYSNWMCPQCREHVLSDFRKIKEYL